MKILIQRVKQASVTINKEKISSIEKGILAFVGIEKGDTLENIQKGAKKVVNLRIFPDENDKMNITAKIPKRANKKRLRCFSFFNFLNRKRCKPLSIGSISITIQIQIPNHRFLQCRPLLCRRLPVHQ